MGLARRFDRKWWTHDSRSPLAALEAHAHWVAGDDAPTRLLHGHM